MARRVPQSKLHLPAANFAYWENAFIAADHNLMIGAVSVAMVDGVETRLGNWIPTAGPVNSISPCGCVAHEMLIRQER